MSSLGRSLRQTCGNCQRTFILSDLFELAAWRECHERCRLCYRQSLLAAGTGEVPAELLRLSLWLPIASVEGPGFVKTG